MWCDDGQRIDGTNPDRIVRHGIVQVMEGRRIIADMTVIENLQLGAFTRADRANVARDIEWYLGGAGEQRKSFKNLKGYRRRKRWL